MQFNLPPSVPPPPPPAWAEALGRFLTMIFRPFGRLLAWIGSFFPDAAYARLLLWGVLGLAAVAAAVVIVQRVRRGTWRWRGWRVASPAPADETEEWTPGAVPVRAWLAEADALAAQGRYAEAIHSLLLRTIEDVGGRRPELARPSLTGRELATSALLPGRVRELFETIARKVERSLFGERPIDEPEWLEARRSYSELATAGSWRR